MRKRVIMAMFCLLASASFLKAEAPLRFRYGVEWGYSPQIASSFQYTFLSANGYRVSEGSPDHELDYFTNAFVMAGAGAEFADYFSLSLNVGFRGLYKDFRVVPVELRFAAFFRGYSHNGPFLTVSAGPCLGERFSWDDGTVTASLGAGLRACLIDKVSIDVFARCRVAGLSPLPDDPYEGIIPRERLIHSHRGIILADFGLSLQF